MAGKRMKMLVELSTEVLQHELPDGMRIGFCRVRLLNTVYSYYYDKERYKDFHGSDEPNEEKKSAFLCKWIAKNKPFHVVCDNEKVSRKAFFFYTNLINEVFCVTLFKVLTKKNPNDCFGISFLYNLHYGSPSANDLIVAFDRPS
jgi:hypothetical protein